MMHILPKWTVRVTLEGGAVVPFSIADNGLSGILRKLAEIQFDSPVTKVEIAPAPTNIGQALTSTAVGYGGGLMDKQSTWT